MRQTEMNLRPDYDQIAAELNGAALEKKLEELTHRVPPRKRKRLADVLGPFTERLLTLHGLGWTYRQLADELTASGLPVRVGTLREYLTKTVRSRKSGGRRSASKSTAAAALAATRSEPVATR